MKRWTLLITIIALFSFAAVSAVSAASRATAQAQAASPKIVDFQTNGDFTHLLKSDGSLWRFGLNQSIPTRIELPQPAKKAITIHNGHAMILAEDGTIWAYSASGQQQPYQLPGLTDFVDLYFYGYYAGLKSDGTVWSWGYRENEEWKSNPSMDIILPKYPPEQVAGLTDITAISGIAPTLALNSQGELYIWAYNYWSQPDQLPPSKAKLIRVEGLPSIASFTRGDYTHAAVDESGLMYSWGNWGYNHLGNPKPHPDNKLDPAVRLPGIEGVREVAIGHPMTMFLKQDGTVYTSGRDYYNPSSGALDDPMRPRQVPGLRDIVKVDTHSGQYYALNAKGELYVWGNSSNGRLGDGTLNWQLRLEQPTRILDTGTVIIDGVQQPYPGVIHEGVTMVPLRKLAEPLGATLGFEAETKQVSISYGGQKVSMKPGDATVTVNGNSVQLGGPIRIYNNETHVPLRFVSELFGKQVAWHSEQAEIEVTTAQ